MPREAPDLRQAQAPDPQDQRDMPVPAVRAAHLVVVQARLLLGSLEGMHDALAVGGHAHERFQVTAALRDEGHVGLPVLRIRDGTPEELGSGPCPRPPAPPGSSTASRTIVSPCCRR